MATPGSVSIEVDREIPGLAGIEAAIGYWSRELEIARWEYRLTDLQLKHARELELAIGGRGADISIYSNRLWMTDVWIDEIERNLDGLSGEWFSSFSQGA